MTLILGSQNWKVHCEVGDKIFVIGERINPTSKRDLASELARGETTLLVEEAEKQVRSGAQALDVNVGAACDQGLCMEKAVREIQDRLEVPLVLDSPFPDVLRAGLEAARGRVLVNSITADEKSMASLFPLVVQHQVPFVGLAMDDRGLPETWEERVSRAGKIISRAVAQGIPRDDVVIDPVLLPVRFYPDALFETLTALAAIKETYGVLTCLGVSNISFGLEKRRSVNAKFVALAAGFGLDIGILDPLDPVVMDVVRSKKKETPDRRAVEAFREDCHAING